MNQIESYCLQGVKPINYGLIFAHTLDFMTLIFPSFCQGFNEKKMQSFDAFLLNQFLYSVLIYPKLYIIRLAEVTWSGALIRKKIFPNFVLENQSFWHLWQIVYVRDLVRVCTGRVQEKGNWHPLNWKFIFFYSHFKDFASTALSLWFSPSFFYILRQFWGNFFLNQKL